MTETKVRMAPDRPLEHTPKAIVVGASSGAGAALVRELANHGYRVAAVARREAKLVELCEAINASSGDGIIARPYAHNITRFDETPALFQQIVADLGGLDLIVYVAGVQPAMTVDEFNFEKDAAMVNVNMLGAMAWLGEAGLRFARAKAGHIVGVSSIAADRGRRPNPAYNASKAGLDTYLEALRNRLSQHEVTVTTIRPGFMDTALLENAAKPFWVVSPTEAARQIYRAVRKRKQVVYIPGRWRFVSLIIKHIPSIIFRRLSF